jgi:hypothetical protein
MQFSGWSVDGSLAGRDDPDDFDARSTETEGGRCGNSYHARNVSVLMKEQHLSTRAVIGIPALILGVAYAAIGLSPLKATIGRQHPNRASLFSPPWFNFGATYTDGDVLDFRVGMPRAELTQALEKRYASRGVLGGYCAETPQERRLPAEVRIDGGEAYRTLSARSALCLSIPDSRLSLIFELKSDVVDRINVAFIRNELL